MICFYLRAFRFTRKGYAASVRQQSCQRPRSRYALAWHRGKLVKAARLLGTGRAVAVWLPIWAVGADSISARGGSRDRLCAWFVVFSVHPSTASPWGEAGARSTADEGTITQVCQQAAPHPPLCAHWGTFPQRGEGFWEAVFPGSPEQRADPPSAPTGVERAQQHPPSQRAAAGSFRNRPGSA